jgi:hypothetical protein
MQHVKINSDWLITRIAINLVYTRRQMHFVPRLLIRLHIAHCVLTRAAVFMLLLLLLIQNALTAVAMASPSSSTDTDFVFPSASSYVKLSLDLRMTATFWYMLSDGAAIVVIVDLMCCRVDELQSCVARRAMRGLACRHHKEPP